LALGGGKLVVDSMCARSIAIGHEGQLWLGPWTEIAGMQVEMDQWIFANNI
jgi:hypothetical protein